MLDDLDDPSGSDFSLVGEDQVAAARGLDDGGKQAAAGKRGVSTEEVFEEIRDAVFVKVGKITADSGVGELGGGEIPSPACISTRGRR